MIKPRNLSAAIHAITDNPESKSEAKTTSPYGDPVISYLLAHCAASIIFVTSMSQLQQYGIGFAIFAWVLGGFLPAQALMTVPWALAVRHYRRTRLASWTYFPLFGAASTVTLGCTAAPFMPKLLNVEDQTFLEAASIALEPQGPSFLLSGLIFGLTYWLLYVRFRL